MSRVLTPCQKIEQSLLKKYRKSIWNQFTYAVKHYELIQPGDKIAVCISGGKDSMLMAKLMQMLQRHSLLPLCCGQHMGRLGGYYTKAGRLSHQRQLTAGQHPHIHAAQRRKPQEAVFMTRDDKADLIQMRVQQYQFGVFLSAAADAHHIVQSVPAEFIHQRTEHLLRQIGYCADIAGRTGGTAQALQ